MLRRWRWCWRRRHTEIVWFNTSRTPPTHLHTHTFSCAHFAFVCVRAARICVWMWTVCMTMCGRTSSQTVYSNVCTNVAINLWLTWLCGSVSEQIRRSGNVLWRWQSVRDATNNSWRCRRDENISTQKQEKNANSIFMSKMKFKGISWIESYSYDENTASKWHDACEHWWLEDGWVHKPRTPRTNSDMNMNEIMALEYLNKIWLVVHVWRRRNEFPTARN